MTSSGTGSKRPAIFADAAPKAKRVGGASGIANPGVELALRQIGFDAARSGTPLRAPVLAPPAPPKIANDAADLALRRRDWMLENAERQRALSSAATGIPRVRDLTRDAFLNQFYAASRPVVIEGALTDWPALDKWTPDYLARLVGAAPVEFQGGRGRSAEFELLKDDHKQTMAFDKYMAMITADGAGNDAYITAYNSSANLAAFAPLDADTGPIDAYLTPGNGMLWIGPGGTFTPLHFDLTNNLLAQVTGTKRITLLPPSETRYLAHNRHVFSDVHDINSADHLARYPAARLARRFTIDLGPGDLLYIPVGWWHQVSSLNFSVMLTYTNFLWPNDASARYPSS